MASIFTKIINGEIPCHQIGETEDCFAFLDIAPLRAGHTLVIPKKEIDYFYDLDDETISKVMLFSKKVAAAIEKTFPCERISIVVAGLEVPHAHVHLIPMNAISDIDFSQPKMTLTHPELAEMAERIRGAMNNVDNE